MGGSRKLGEHTHFCNLAMFDVCVCIYVGIYYPFLYVKLYNTFKTSQITFNLIT